MNPLTSTEVLRVKKRKSAASGMGRATARVFAAEGANAAVTDVGTEGVKSVATEITTSGGTTKAWTLDVSDREAIARVIPQVATHFGGLDIIVNNADDCRYQQRVNRRQRLI